MSRPRPTLREIDRLTKEADSFAARIPMLDALVAARDAEIARLRDLETKARHALADFTHKTAVDRERLQSVISVRETNSDTAVLRAEIDRMKQAAHLAREDHAHELRERFIPRGAAEKICAAFEKERKANRKLEAIKARYHL